MHDYKIPTFKKHLSNTVKSFVYTFTLYSKKYNLATKYVTLYLLFIKLFFLFNCIFKFLKTWFVITDRSKGLHGFITGVIIYSYTCKLN